MFRKQWLWWGKAVTFLLFALTCLAGMGINVLAVPAAPIITYVTQPDGTQIATRLRGDEWFHYRETLQGNPIVQNQKSGQWEYAVDFSKDGPSKTSGVVGKSASPRSFIPKEPAGVAAMRASAAQRSIRPTGTAYVLTILVNFSDTTPTYTVGDFDSMLFSSGNDTMKGIYENMSRGKFSVSAGPAGVRNWITVSKPHDYYAKDKGYEFAAELVKEAVQLADAAGLDFAPYDQDNDGYVDVVNIIHQGVGAEVGSPDKDIWSHRWNLFSAGVGIYTTRSGVKVNDYIINPEKYLNDEQHSVGVFCHEYGHALGLPDLYDTDDSSTGIGMWSLMAAGNWGESGHSPTEMDAWCKVQLGWIVPQSVTSNIINAAIADVKDGGTVYKMRDSSFGAKEYFLIENRQQKGGDIALPGSGLLIWHIDEDRGDNKSEWYPGHTGLGHYKVALEQADGRFDMESKRNVGDSGDPFPGSSGNSFFDQSSIPNSRSYGGSDTYLAVRNISNPRAVMNADLIVGLSYSYTFSNLRFSNPAPLTGTSFVASVTLTNTGAAWGAGYTLERTGYTGGYPLSDGHSIILPNIGSGGTWDVQIPMTAPNTPGVYTETWRMRGPNGYFGPEIIFTISVTAQGTTLNKIAFVSTRDGNPEIYVMNSDGSAQTRLTNNTGYDWTPAFSPDGNKIAFMSNRNGHWDIYVMNADGSGISRLTNEGHNNTEPQWNFSGDKIAFTSDRDGNKNVYVMDANGGSVVRLTTNSSDDWRPVWSPGGDKIAFVSDRDGNQHVYVMNANGSNQTRLMNISYDTYPTWSAANMIAFMTANKGWDIYATNATGSNTAPLIQSTFDDRDPDWSFDAQRIVFASNRDGNDEIYIANSDGTNQIRLTNNTFDDYQPSFGPVSSSVPIISISTSGTGNNIYTFKISDFENALGRQLTKVKIISLPTHGVLKLNGNIVTANTEISRANLGNLVYTPNTGYSGNDSFQVQIHDGTEYSGTGTVNITVNKVVITNHPPVANNLTIITEQGIPVKIIFSGSDADGDTLSYKLGKTLPKHGTFSGTLTNLFYYPHSNFYGVDSFTYVATDGKEDSAEATVTITVKAVTNRPPIAEDQTEVIDQDVIKRIVLKNHDPDGDALEYGLVTSPKHGTLSGSFTNLFYAPNIGYTGTDSFSYVANDGRMNSRVATVSITVVAVANHPPVVSDKTLRTTMETSVTTSLLGYDADNDTLEYGIVKGPRYGKVSGSASQLKYTPNDGFVGTDSFTYVANDGKANSNVGTITIVVSGTTSGIPVAYNQEVFVSAGGQVEITLTGSDPNNLPLDYYIDQGPSYGMLLKSLYDDRLFLYRPTQGFVGTDSFTFVVDNGDQESAIATVTIHVTP